MRGRGYTSFSVLSFSRFVFIPCSRSFFLYFAPLSLVLPLSFRLFMYLSHPTTCLVVLLVLVLSICLSVSLFLYFICSLFLFSRSLPLSPTFAVALPLFYLFLCPSMHLPAYPAISHLTALPPARPPSFPPSQFAFRLVCAGGSVELFI